MGAHVIKCGLGPWIIELMERGVIQSVSTNGAGPIHDFEIALIGETSEDVGPGLNDGTFGMAEETGRLMSEALDREDVRSGQMGMGRALGLKLIEMHAPHAEQSVLANAARLGIPFTVHVGIGTDIIHMRTNSAGALLGQASFTDFRLFTALVMRLSGGGVYLNVGSSVILPEVFLKAFTIAQNLGADLRDFVTVNLDMVQQYRPMQNVVSRPAAVGGRGYSITGHHELMVPLLGWAVLDRLGPKGS
jgi:deoxyhypusine synthase